jgi:hypothetical protein
MTDQVTDQQLWKLLGDYGNIQPLWWYTAAAVPAFILSLCTYLLVWHTLVQRREQLVPMLLWLVTASLAPLLILPSFYARVALGDMLRFVNLTRPAVVQDWSITTTTTVGEYLSYLAWMGIVGGLLSLLVLASSLVRGALRYRPLLALPTANSRSQKQISQLERSGKLTETFDPPQGSAVAGLGGTITVSSGQHEGTSFGVTQTVIIGSHKATLTITDSIVSRHHARIDVQGGVVSLVDLGSRNGTYLRHAGDTARVNGQAVPLQSGDTIFLGNPALPNAVKLTYERPAPEKDPAVLG